MNLIVGLIETLVGQRLSSDIGIGLFLNAALPSEGSELPSDDSYKLQGRWLRKSA